MKKAVLIAILGLIVALGSAGCERNDYKHPLHRGQGK